METLPPSFSGCPARGVQFGQEAPPYTGPGFEASNVVSYGGLPGIAAPPAQQILTAPHPSKARRPVEEFFAEDGGGDLNLMRQLRKHWPHYYTLACLALFSAPVTAVLHLAEDASVEFWIGNWGYAALLVPWLLALCHLYNSQVGELRMLPVIYSTVVPCIVLGVIANVHIALSTGYALQLLSKDCTTWKGKRDLQSSWTQAATLYERCVNRTTAEHGLRFVDGLAFIRLQDCAEYAVQTPDIWAGQRESWRYLQRMELEHECSGWCYHTVALWSFQGTKDACSVTAGNVMIERVKWVSHRHLCYALVSGLTCIFAIMAYGSRMRAKGREWQLV